MKRIALLLALALVAVPALANATTSYNVSITKQLSACGTSDKSFTGTANYNGDDSTRLIVTFDGETVISDTNEQTSWSFQHTATAGETYEVKAYVYSQDNPVLSGEVFDSPQSQDSWEFTVPPCEEPPVDVCPNDEGVQTCEEDCTPPPPVDVCPEDEGVQTSTDDCTVPPPTDVCPNDEGVQTSEEQCTPEEPPTDVCPNDEGVQTDPAQCTQEQPETPPTDTGGSSGGGGHHHRNRSGSGTSKPTPACEAPALVQGFAVHNAVPGDGKLELSWIPGNNLAVVIRYGHTIGQWLTYVGATDDGAETISGLTTGQHYWFQLIPFTCQFGTWTEPVDPLP